MPSPARGKLLLIIGAPLRVPRRRLAGAERGSRTKLHYLMTSDAPPPLERADDRLRRPSSPVMISRPCRKFRRLDAPVLSPISRVDENNGYGDDAALELALQASLEDAARATPRRQPAPPPGPQLHPFG